MCRGFFVGVDVQDLGEHWRGGLLVGVDVDVDRMREERGRGGTDFWAWLLVLWARLVGRVVGDCCCVVAVEWCRG